MVSSRGSVFAFNPSVVLQPGSVARRHQQQEMHPAISNSAGSPSTTDGKGGFQFDSVDSDSVSSIQVTGAGIVTTSIGPFSANEKFIHVAQPARKVAGIVVDRKTGKPISNVAVSASNGQQSSTNERKTIQVGCENSHQDTS